MIRIMLIDDHPAVRAGLETVLRAEPGLVAVASCDGSEALWPQFNRTRPDLVLLDFHLPTTNSLVLCRRMKALVPRPWVLFYSAYADASLAVPLRVAGADGMVSKAAPAPELFRAIHAVADGQRVLPSPSPDLVRGACGPLSTEDRVIMGLLLDGTTVAGIAEVLRLDSGAVRTRVERLLGRLAPAASEASPAVPAAG